MQISGLWQIFAVGALGGVFVEILRWWKIRESPNLPAYARSPLYWAVTILMVLSGGILAVLYGTNQRNALMVANIGATAPALIGAFTTKSKTGSRVTRGNEGKAKEPPPDKLRRFLAFEG